MDEVLDRLDRHLSKAYEAAGSQNWPAALDDLSSAVVDWRTLDPEDREALRRLEAIVRLARSIDEALGMDDNDEPAIGAAYLLGARYVPEVMMEGLFFLVRDDDGNFTVGGDPSKYFRREQP